MAAYDHLDIHYESDSCLYVTWATYPPSHRKLKVDSMALLFYLYRQH